MHSAQVFGTIATLGALGLVGSTALGAHVVHADSVCVQDNFSAGPSPRLYSWGTATETWDTGITIPGPAAGETVRVISASGTSYDQYPLDNSPTRAEADQANERWTFSVGSDIAGPLSSDLPDTVDEGAVDDYYSGVRGATFDPFTTGGGSVVILQAGQFGYRESANSLVVSGLTFVVERCTEVPPETTESTTTTTEVTTTTAAPTTSTSAVTTTTVIGQAGPTTTAATTTSAPTATAQQQTTTTVGAASGGPTSTIRSSLPTTGAGDRANMLFVASLLVLGGAVVMFATRRRAA